MEEILALVEKYHFGRSYYILESYDFEFVEGTAGEYLIMENKELGKKVKVTPNKYFGCTAVLLEEQQL